MTTNITEENFLIPQIFTELQIKQQRFVKWVHGWLHMCSATTDTYKIPAQLVLMLNDYHNYALTQPESKERDELLASTKGFDVIAKTILEKEDL